MSNFIIHGGKKLSGAIPVGSGKNSPIALICASLLVRAPVVLADMSRVEEAERLLAILASIGVRYEWRDERTLFLDASRPLSLDTIDRATCSQTRVALLLLGALAKRETGYRLYKSGGCKLGNRTVRPHMFALEKFGVQVQSRAGYYQVSTVRLHAADVVLYESGDTATENAIMAAVLAPGTSTIRYASANYMVQD